MLFPSRVLFVIDRYGAIVIMLVGILALVFSSVKWRLLWRRLRVWHFNRLAHGYGLGDVLYDETFGLVLRSEYYPSLIPLEVNGFPADNNLHVAAHTYERNLAHIKHFEDRNDQFMADWWRKNHTSYFFKRNSKP